MTDRDSKIREYKSLNQPAYGVLNKLTILRTPPTAGKWDGTLSIWMDMFLGVKDPSILKMEFHGVRQLELLSKQLDGMSGYHIDIQSIEDDQWEDLNYRVTDLERNLFSFVCRNFTARNIGKDMKYCSFCGKMPHEVRMMVAGGGGVYICSECVDLAGQIPRTKSPDEGPKDGSK